jgi:predicted RNA-binding protein (virulence factor B family)
MTSDDLVGRVVTLTVQRTSVSGALLASDDPDSRMPAIPLPSREVPEGTRVGDRLEVFIYLDAERRRTATLALPTIALGEVALLPVTEVLRDGALVDAAMPDPLFVPQTEITRDLRVGERHAIGLVVDDTGQLAGTMRVSEMLHVGGRFERDEWVEGEAWRDESGIGLFVIVERRYLGLVPAYEPHALRPGDWAQFRVSSVLADGKVNLSLRGHAHLQLDSDADHVLAVVSRPGAARVGDHSSPEVIRSLFGLSKKAFKRAVGTLLKRRAVALDADGFVTPVKR